MGCGGIGKIDQLSAGASGASSSMRELGGAGRGNVALPRPSVAASVLGRLREHREGQDVAADAPAAVGDLFDQDHGVGAGPFAVDLDVELGGAGDDLFLLLLVEGSCGDLEVGERHGGSLFWMGYRELPAHAQCRGTGGSGSASADTWQMTSNSTAYRSGHGDGSGGVGGHGRPCSGCGTRTASAPRSIRRCRRWHG